ncbi:MAG: hypothetical protein MRZ54_09720, partial [Clostridiales bacterium]|nr:hypothetical protein [Clostridiales bacterium]
SPSCAPHAAGTFQTKAPVVRFSAVCLTTVSTLACPGPRELSFLFSFTEAGFWQESTKPIQK